MCEVVKLMSAVGGPQLCGFLTYLEKKMRKIRIMGILEWKSATLFLVELVRDGVTQTSRRRDELIHGPMDGKSD